MEETTLRVFEHRVLRKIFGTERGEVTGGWTELCNKELNDLFCTPHNVLRYLPHGAESFLRS